MQQGKSRGGETKNSLCWADRDERRYAFSQVTFHQCKNTDQILADSKMAIVCPKCFMETEFSSGISSSWFSTEQKEKPSFWWKSYLSSWTFIWWQCCSHHVRALPADTSVALKGPSKLPGRLQENQKGDFAQVNHWQANAPALFFPQQGQQQCLHREATTVGLPHSKSWVLQSLSAMRATVSKVRYKTGKFSPLYCCCRL